MSRRPPVQHHSDRTGTSAVSFRAAHAVLGVVRRSRTTDPGHDAHGRPGTPQARGIARTASPRPAAAGFPRPRHSRTNGPHRGR